MNAHEFLEVFQRHLATLGENPQVLVQAAGCCSHAHPILAIELGQPTFNTVSTIGEVGAIVIRVADAHTKSKKDQA